MVGFVRLRDLNGGRFFITRFQKQLVLFRYEFSMAVGFGGLRDLSDGRFWRVMKLQ